MKYIAIVTAGTLPVPPVKGGAVENLIDLLIKENEKNPEAYFTVFSIFDKDANNKANIYKNTNFKFIKIPLILKAIDLMIYALFAYILKKNKSMSYRYISSRIYYIFLVSFILRKNDYSKVILENHATLFMCIKLFKNYKKYFGRYIYHAHNELSGTYGCLNEIKNTRTIIGVSKYILNKIETQVNGFSSETQFAILKNKIDRGKFISNIDKSFESKMRKRLNLRNSDRIILFAGRMNKEKGIDILIKAWNRLNIPNAVLLIVGSYYFNSNIKNNRYQTELNELLKKGKNIKFTGFINYINMPSLYDMSELVVLPSMWNDPAPLTVIEALTMGKPLITTYSGGIPEYANTRNSILIKRDEKIIEHLSDEIKMIIENENLKHRLSINALNETNNWTSKQYFRDFISIIENS